MQEFLFHRIAPFLFYPEFYILDEQDKYIRLFADFENFRKRTVKERIELMDVAAKDTLAAILPVLDDFDRAKKNAEDENSTIELLQNNPQLLEQVVNQINNNINQNNQNNQNNDNLEQTIDEEPLDLNEDSDEINNDDIGENDEEINNEHEEGDQERPSGAEGPAQTRMGRRNDRNHQVRTGVHVRHLYAKTP